MGLLEAVFLGAVQGLTEFIPVSSSGHLVIAQSLIPNFSQPGVLFDTFLHLGSVFAVLLYFRKKIFSFERRVFLLLIIATLPVAFVGWMYSEGIEMLFDNLKLVAFALFITGFLNWKTDTLKPEGKKITGALKRDALLVGIFQAFTLFPGLSRSGSTIFAAVWRGFDKKEAASFSFLLSIPAILGSVAWELFKYGWYPDSGTEVYVVGVLAAFVVSYFSIRVVFSFLVSSRFKLFSVYCFILGLTVLLFS